MKILIIDDSKAVHAFLDRCFVGREVSPTHVNHGGEALELLQKQSDFDLILLDWEMPVVDGPTTFDRIVEMGLHIPVLMMTTKNEPDDILFMLTKGARDYMLKPFTADILLEKIEMVLGREVKNAA